MAKTLTPEGQRLKELIDFDKRIYFLVLVFLFLLIRYLTNTLILEAIPDYDNLEARGDFMIFHIFNALNYLWTPFALLWKFTVISFLFWLGAFLIGYKVPYKELWQFALIAEVVFIFPELVRLLVYISPQTGVTYTEIDEFRALSLLSLLGPGNVAPQFHYALATLNIFEIIYGIVWLYGFHMISRRPFGECTIVVFVSYYIPLAIWLTWYMMVYRA
ncbi:sulfate ABC transporter permease [Algoriphagus aquimarinus]|uniref:Sulfate ABC transporter permease n=1 Tax=Algoriphagus aquimarinus TaxID=237018 RepID=A0A5C7AX73_9BACT|nr:sulfate ABC transporter permease [Algoriphagus aquimarinus]TXE13360.1 sulfate ABC transporter permease [Algoriphagus aquimarinus]